ncbi:MULTISPECIES: CRISPR-associated endonuclease Cas2 [Clostridium]|uniref:CRISPR-associated endoribonuclease Cas2 n=1 Tax=Clostridium putrefaciens TaxID=99675 RepID=A0A381J619_9CLOT|nr:MULTISPECIES: CRISPR-associated endonuclease Cas2 [Clostridium]MBU3196473.1 CRISPR-associated endonuclease Cas2 [Clostridium algidicarnis]SUY46407.1 CRISPR-associated endoribonuclease Cas2 [Clostridium putrefaciens]
MIYLVSYDIVDDKKRYRLHKMLKNFGSRNQYSVFECDLDGKKYVELEYNIRKIKIEKGDSIMVYPICSSCESKIIRKGSFVPLDVTNMIY